MAEAPEEPAAKPVELAVSPARFSAEKQRPGDEVTLSLTIKNTGSNPAPEVLVQLRGLEKTTLADPMDEGRLRTTPDDLPNAVTRAAWFVDGWPGDTPPLGASNLYPGGRLEPGRTRTMRWRLSAQRGGDHTLEYQVFSGTTDNAAKATSGTGLKGTVSATISEK